jgi:hypothetical protein
MSSRRAHRQIRNVCGLLIALAWVLAPTRAAAQTKKVQPQKQDEICLACHGTPGMKSDKGKNIAVDPAKHSASSHGIFGCTDCHTDVKDFPHPARIAKVRCRTCHEDVVKAFDSSVHSLLGDAACSTCRKSAPNATRRKSRSLIPAFMARRQRTAILTPQSVFPATDQFTRLKRQRKRILLSLAKNWPIPARNAIATPVFSHATKFLSLIPSILTSRAHMAGPSPREVTKRQTATIATGITTSSRPVTLAPV